MKLQSVLVGLSAASATAAVAINGAVPDKEIIDALLENNGYLMTPRSHRIFAERTRIVHKKRDPQTSDLLTALIAGGGGATNKNAPNSSVPETKDVPAQAWKGAKRTKVRYGPYRMPPTSEKNLESQLLNVQGMSNTLKIGAKKPCEKDCTVLALWATLEDANGVEVGNKEGSWLHHIVLLNSGPKVIEPNCGAARVENIFMSGNERSTGGFALPNATMKSGYSLTPQDKFILTTQLMNMEDKEKWVWVVITYEYLDGPTPPDYKQGRTIWQTIGPALTPACGKKNVTSPWGASNLTASQQPKTDVFSEHSVPWIAPRDGYLMSTGGHMHDGGVSTEIFRNKERICNSVPHYAKTTSGEGHGMAKRQMMGSGPGNADIEHIQKQDGCAFPGGLPLKKGDSMYVQANYDFRQHQGMKNNKGELDEVMGIVGSLVAFDRF